MKTRNLAIFVLLLLGAAPQAFCRIKNRNHEAYGDKCPALHSADPATLLQYLNDNKPMSDNAICVTWAIYGIGDAKYEPGVPALVGLLDFQRPNILWTWEGLPGPLYPAIEALGDIGKPSLLPLLTAIEAPATSPTAQANAVDAWLRIYQLTGKRAHGFAALRRAANAATDDNVKKRLEALIQYGLQRWCSGRDTEAPGCQRAAQDGVDR